MVKPNKSLLCYKIVETNKWYFCYIPTQIFDNYILRPIRLAQFGREKINHSSFGGGGPERSGWLCMSFWTQWASQFLWSWASWQFELGILSRFPSLSRTILNFSNTWTICQNSGLFSGCKAQHCSIRSRNAAGQLLGMAGLSFWKMENYVRHVLSRKSQNRGPWEKIVYVILTSETPTIQAN